MTRLPSKTQAWLSEPLSAEVQRSVARLARLDDVVRIALMPDVHLAENVCVGAVVASRSGILPDAVGGDIGCGMGRVVCLFARAKIKKSIGVEISAELAKIARLNAQRLRGRKAVIEIIVADAAEADYSEGTIFFLLNPFGRETLEAVLDRIKPSVEAFPRHIQILYVNPFHEEVLKGCGWLKCVGVDQPLLFKTYASYWTNEV